MRIAVLLLGALAACGPRSGTVQATWQGATGPGELKAPGSGGWCPETRTVLVDATSGDDVVGVVWRYEGEGPAEGSYPLGVPSDSTPAAASAALRYVHLDEVRGFRSVFGTLTLTAADTTRVSGTLTAQMQRVGEADSTPLELRFQGIPLLRDPTVCVAPPAPAPDTVPAIP